MESFLKNIMLLLMSEKCYLNYVHDYNFFDVPCFKALLSKGLGITIVAASTLVKVPQIQKILHNQSAKGINFLSVLLDLSAITFFVAYSFVKQFPFSSWGDGFFNGVQTLTIAALVLFYNGMVIGMIGFLIGYACILYALTSGLTPLPILATLQALTIPIILVGRSSQAWTNYKNKSTGQLSAITSFMLLLGALARIFTSIQETGDSMMVATFGVSAFANGVIVAQLLYYWNSADHKKTADGKGKQRKSKDDNVSGSGSGNSKPSTPKNTPKNKSAKIKVKKID